MCERDRCETRDGGIDDGRGEVGRECGGGAGGGDGADVKVGESDGERVASDGGGVMDTWKGLAGCQRREGWFWWLAGAVGRGGGSWRGRCCCAERRPWWMRRIRVGERLREGAAT